MHAEQWLWSCSLSFASGLCQFRLRRPPVQRRIGLHHFHARIAPVAAVPPNSAGKSVAASRMLKNSLGRKRTACNRLNTWSQPRKKSSPAGPAKQADVAIVPRKPSWPTTKPSQWQLQSRSCHAAKGPASSPILHRKLLPGIESLW